MQIKIEPYALYDPDSRGGIDLFLVFTAKYEGLFPPNVNRVDAVFADDINAKVEEGIGEIVETVDGNVHTFSTNVGPHCDDFTWRGSPQDALDFRSPDGGETAREYFTGRPKWRRTLRPGKMVLWASVMRVFVDGNAE